MTGLTPTERWYLGWRMIESAQLNNDLERAALQFDSLREQSRIEELDYAFLATGLGIQSELGKTEAVAAILAEVDEAILERLCENPSLAEQPPCAELPPRPVTHPELQREILRMYVIDQAVRGNVMEEMIAQYELDTTGLSQTSPTVADAQHRDRLREIFAEYGFPNREMIGRRAMRGVFFIIQHADNDPDWQSEQLPAIERAVRNGDLDGQQFAYLYDRIQVNAGEPQRYGTQFIRVDAENRTLELATTAAPEHLDERRRAIGLMPIELYKRFMLRSITGS